MRKALGSVSLIFLLVGSSKAGFLVDFEVSVGGIQQKPSGYASYKPVIVSDRIDLKRDANVEDKTNYWVKLKFEHPIPLIPNVKLGHMPMKFDGKGTLTRDIRWGNFTYEANTEFDFSVKLDRIDGTLYYNFPFLKTATAGVLDVEFGVNLRAINFDGKLTGVDKTSSQRVSESKSLTLPIPMGHLAAEISPIRLISLVGELNYVKYDKNSYYDYAAGLRLNSHGILLLPLKPFVEIGYRYERLKLVDVSDIDAQVKIKGGYVLVGIKF